VRLARDFSGMAYKMMGHRPAEFVAAHRIGWIRSRLLTSILVASSISAANAQAPDFDDIAAQQTRSVEIGREGRYDEALGSLQQLRLIDPYNERLLHDQIVILGWATRDQDVLEKGLPIGVDNAPTYVQLAVAKSARNLTQFDLAAEWYEHALANDRSNLQARLGLALTYADQRNITAAKRIIATINPTETEFITVQLAHAYVLERADDLIHALARYDAILADHPENRDALRGKALVLRSLLLPRQALQLAIAYPGILSEQETDRLRVDDIAIQMRLVSKTPYPRNDHTDHLNSTLDALNELDAAASDEETKGALAYDRVVLLADLNQAEAAVAAFEKLRENIEFLPPYVLAAAGRAYLQNQQPGKALRVLESAVGVNSNDSELKFTLIYAYLDLGRYRDAYALTDALTAELPLINGETDSPVIKGNQDRLRAELIAGIAEAYGDQFAAAQQRFEELLVDAPHNSDLRHELANVYRWRGWLDRSLFEYRQVLAVDENLLSARTGYTHAQLDARQFREVEATVEKLNTTAKNEPAVVQLSERWQLHNKHELQIVGSFGESSGATFGTDQYRVDTTFYTKPMAYHIRGMVVLHHSFAEFPEGDSRRQRIGVGAEYRAERWTALGELSTNRNGGRDLGVRGSIDWRIGDRWALVGLLDLNSNDVPLRGYRVGVSADSLGATVRFAPHEATALDLSWRYFDFTDGNAQTRVSANGRHRLIGQPRWKLDLTGQLFASRNELQSTAYFSPAHDFGVFAGAALEWSVLRRYERSLVLVAQMETGRYEQADFRAGELRRLNLELRLELSSALQLDFRAERARMFYDGAPEYETSFVASVRARF